MLLLVKIKHVSKIIFACGDVKNILPNGGFCLQNIKNQ
jgi:hypothetical protein